MVIHYGSPGKLIQILLTWNEVLQLTTKTLEVALELDNGQGWKNFGAHNSKNLDCLEDTDGRNMVIKNNFVESS